MDYEQNLLIELHRAADMGQSTLDRLMPHIEDGAFRALVDRRREEYNRVFIAADAKIKAMSGNDHGAPRMALTMGGMVTDMRASMDNSPSYLSEVILKGIDKGLKEVNNAIQQYGSGATPETMRLATQFREFLQNGREEFSRWANCNEDSTC